MQDLQPIIEDAFERRTDINPANADMKIKDAVFGVLEELDAGRLRVAEKIEGQWITHQWIKKAVLLSFRLEDNVVLDGGCTRYFDKVPPKFADYDADDFKNGGFRVVPNAMVRRGSFIGKNVVL